MKYPCLGDSSTDTLYPAMKAIVGQMGTEEEFGEPVVTSTQHILHPRGAPEIKKKGKGRIIRRALRLSTISDKCTTVRRGPMEAAGGASLADGGDLGGSATAPLLCGARCGCWDSPKQQGNLAPSRVFVARHSACSLPRILTLILYLKQLYFRKELEEENCFALFC